MYASAKLPKGETSKVFRLGKHRRCLLGMRNHYIRGHCADSAPLLVGGNFEVERGREQG